MPEQLALQLLCDPTADPALRRAWLRSGLRLPFHVAVHIPALAICLRHLAEAGHPPLSVTRAPKSRHARS